MTIGLAGAPALTADLLDDLAAAAPQADRQVIGLALEAWQCAGAAPTARRLAVIDYSLPSTAPRLWVFDLERRRLLYVEHVTHGKGSGDNYARAFSNRHGSLQSSLGLFVTGETYHGRNGYSLRMDGLESGINDQARARDIVMHGADYANPAFAARFGRLGRSWGCPAVRSEVAREIIDTLRDGQLLFAYYPDQSWLASSPVLGCTARHAPAGGTVAGASR
ncbi:MAG: murein L,D-transpeptidase catalytic domain family protein [Thermoanaerobaculia bacterium]